MGRPLDKHIDEEELGGLVPSIDRPQGVDRTSSDALWEADRHVATCAECRARVEQYRLLVDRTEIGTPVMRVPEADCPTDIDWDEVAAGLWPELRTQQLISHAAQCA